MARARARSPRKRPQQARSRATWDAILDAAARVLVEEGYDRANTNRIAEVAGVGIGSLYEYFPGKDAIFTEVRRRLSRQMFAVVGRTMEEVLDLPVREAVERVVDVLIRAYSVDPRLDIALKEQVPTAALADQSREIERGLFRLGMEFARRHEKELRRRELELAVFIAIQASASLTVEATRLHPKAIRDGRAAREISDLITRYLVV